MSHVLSNWTSWFPIKSDFLCPNKFKVLVLERNLLFTKTPNLLPLCYKETYNTQMILLKKSINNYKLGENYTFQNSKLYYQS